MGKNMYLSVASEIPEAFFVFSNSFKDREEADSLNETT
jgi:hypothetical protein